ncbi:flagellar basal body P-ring protein FlgI [Deferribacteraceae bacterium V6Fe1]|nr:flagellar basal body P-ring protein FlgI [Deferribacteraceae bacterium V6Fe1]
MKKYIIIIMMLLTASFLEASVKIRDIATIDGIRDNQLIGYGLVVGLNGTGDKSGTEFTIQSLVNMLDRMGITVDKAKVSVKNVAAVMVTAKLSPFAGTGTKVDVVVSSIGDAKSLEGGTLLLTPLSAPNGQIYAVAQGPISVGGMNVSAGGAGAVKNHPTVGRIPNGALIEKEIPFNLSSDYLSLSFSNLSISNIVQAKNTINRYFGEDIAVIANPTTIKIIVPQEFKNNYYEFVNKVISLEIQPETFAKVVVDERTGTIVMGSDVRISTVAVSHGNLTIKITNTVEVSQPAPFSEGQTVVTNNQEVQVEEEDAKLMMIPEGVKISDLVKALNAIKVSPRDLIAVLQAIKAAGALQGELEVI